MYYSEKHFEREERSRVGRGKDIVPSKQCRNCGAGLETSPEHAEGDWFIQCLFCGAKNIVIPVLQVIGWRI